MRAKTDFKNKAIVLRKLGFSYSEILKQIPVAKSSLSLWLHDLPLNKRSKKRLFKKFMKLQHRGAEAKRKQRLARTKMLVESARLQVEPISKEHLLLLGTMLYWAEGTKQKTGNVSQQVAFANSDPLMCRLFVKWIRDCFGVTEDMVIPSIYIHLSRKSKAKEALRYWSKEIRIPEKNFKKTSFTNTKMSKHRQRKDRENYFGQLRIRIRKSTDLNRRIGGLIEGVCVRCGVVSG